MICHECGGLLHVGLGRHVCLAPDAERLCRRTEQARETAEQLRRMTVGFATMRDAMNDAGAKLADALRLPIRVSATVGVAIDCRLGERCWAHGHERRTHRAVGTAG